MKHFIVVIGCVAIVALVGIYVYYDVYAPKETTAADQERIDALRMAKVSESSRPMTKEEAMILMEKVSKKQ